MQLKIVSQLVAVEPNGQIVVTVPDGANVLFQTVERYNGTNVEIITVTEETDE